MSRRPRSCRCCWPIQAARAWSWGASEINLTGRDGKPRPPLLNARTDGMRQGKFRTHLAQRRCIIPAAGFYEWRDEEGKQPYFFHRKDGQALMLAGIWDEAEYKGDRRPAFAILTDEPNALIAPYHDRMPVALGDDQLDAWLDLSQLAPLDLPLMLDLDAFRGAADGSCRQQREGQGSGRHRSAARRPRAPGSSVVAGSARPYDSPPARSACLVELPHHGPDP